MDPVAEDEASPTPADAGVGITSTRSVVHGPSAEGLDVCAVDRDHLADEDSRF